MVCIGSIAELESLTGIKVTDLHRETVDKITIPSKRPGKQTFVSVDVSSVEASNNATV
jgi:hypothetical protein